MNATHDDVTLDRRRLETIVLPPNEEGSNVESPSGLPTVGDSD